MKQGQFHTSIHAFLIAKLKSNNFPKVSRSGACQDYIQLSFRLVTCVRLILSLEETSQPYLHLPTVPLKFITITRTHLQMMESCHHKNESTENMTHIDRIKNVYKVHSYLQQLTIPHTQ
jgi:hypothetical protein